MATTPVLLTESLRTAINKDRHSPAKGVVVLKPARVQIPASPLKPAICKGLRVFPLFTITHDSTGKYNSTTPTVTLTRYSHYLFFGIKKRRYPVRVPPGEFRGIPRGITCDNTNPDVRRGAERILQLLLLSGIFRDIHRYRSSAGWPRPR